MNLIPRLLIGIATLDIALGVWLLVRANPSMLGAVLLFGKAGIAVGLVALRPR